MLLLRGLQFKEREKDSRELESITINTRLSFTVVLKFMRGNKTCFMYHSGWVILAGINFGKTVLSSYWGKSN